MTRPARPPRAGDFGLAKGGGALMAVVRLGTFSRYGHASICEAVDAGGRAWVIEPMPTGCRRRLANVGEFVWSDVDLTAAQAEQVVEYARSTIGLGYDWPAILGFVARFWGAKARGRSDDHADDKLICSETAAGPDRPVMPFFDPWRGGQHEPVRTGASSVAGRRGPAGWRATRRSWPATTTACDRATRPASGSARG
jgi:hypothetical protein